MPCTNVGLAAGRFANAAAMAEETKLLDPAPTSKSSMGTAVLGRT